MLGDVLLIGEIHKQAAIEIFEYVMADRVKKGDNYKYMISVSGESGSGKSELAHVLANLLKNESIRAKLLHIDNYYKIPPLLRFEWRKTHGIESVGLQEIDWRLLNENILDFKEDRESMMPCVDIISEQVDKLITDFRKVNVLVLDGLYAQTTDSIDMKIFIDLTYHETKMAQLVREKETYDSFREKVLEQEHQIISKYKDDADIIVDKTYQVIKVNKC